MIVLCCPSCPNKYEIKKGIPTRAPFVFVLVSLNQTQHLRRERTVDVFFVVVRVHESRSTSSEGDPQLGKFVLSRQVNLNTPGVSQALLTICSMSVLSVCEPSIEGKISKILTEFCIS